MLKLVTVLLVLSCAACSACGSVQLPTHQQTFGCLKQQAVPVVALLTEEDAGVDVAAVEAVGVKFDSCIAAAVSGK
jgi:DNA-binding transcriptional regulator of glucitol operon